MAHGLRSSGVLQLITENYNIKLSRSIFNLSCQAVLCCTSIHYNHYIISGSICQVLFAISFELFLIFGCPCQAVLCCTSIHYNHYIISGSICQVLFAISFELFLIFGCPCQAVLCCTSFHYNHYIIFSSICQVLFAISFELFLIFWLSVSSCTVLYLFSLSPLYHIQFNLSSAFCNFL